MGGFVGEILGTKKADTSGMEAASGRSMDLERQMYEESVARGEPFYQGGLEGFNELNRLLGLGNATGEGAGSLMETYDPSTLTEDPSYQFRLAEGEKALQRQASAMGQSLAPSTSKALMEYGQNLASTEYANQYDRYRANQQDLYNRLANIAGVGQTQQQQLAGLGSQYAGNVSQIDMSTQQARTAAQEAAYANRAALWGSGAQAAGTAAAASDKNLKENIEKVGSENGYNIYEFNYIGQPERWRGVMAQEILEQDPDYVVEKNGFLAVKYDDIGVKFERVN